MGDAFIILPGGIGTLEELADTANQRHIYGDPFAQPPIIICNIEHIYDGLLAQIKTWEEAGFIESSEWGNLHVAETMEDVMGILKMKTKQGGVLEAAHHS